MSSVDLNNATKGGGNGVLAYGGYGSPEMQALQLMRGGIDRIRANREDPAPAPAPTAMATIDDETIQRARRRAIARMAAGSSGRDSTLLSQPGDSLGGS